MVSSQRWYWAPWKSQCEGVTLQNLWWRTVGKKQLHFYYNSDFVAGDKYSFIAYGWALCSGEPNSSGTSNHLVAQPVTIIIPFFRYKPSQQRFQILPVNKIQQDKCIFMCEGIYFCQKWPLLLEMTFSVTSFSFTCFKPVNVHKSVCQLFTS